VGLFYLLVGGKGALLLHAWTLDGAALRAAAQQSSTPEGGPHLFQQLRGGLGVWRVALQRDHARLRGRDEVVQVADLHGARELRHVPGGPCGGRGQQRGASTHKQRRAQRAAAGAHNALQTSCWVA